jgi:hypothetical protein
MDNNRGKSDAHTSSKDNKTVEVLKIGMSQLEDVIIKTPVIETVVFVNKEKVQLSLVQDVAVSDDVDCPVVIDEGVILVQIFIFSSFIKCIIIPTVSTFFPQIIFYFIHFTFLLIKIVYTIFYTVLFIKMYYSTVGPYGTNFYPKITFCFIHLPFCTLFFLLKCVTILIALTARFF